MAQSKYITHCYCDTGSLLLYSVEEDHLGIGKNTKIKMSCFSTTNISSLKKLPCTRVFNRTATVRDLPFSLENLLKQKSIKRIISPFFHRWFTYCSQPLRCAFDALFAAATSVLIAHMYEEIKLSFEHDTVL